MEDSKNIAASRFLDNLIQKRHTPGIQYLLVREGQTAFEFNRGLSSFENLREVNASTLFNACSFTKTFTALAVMQCVEAGKLSLNDYASYWMDLYPYHGEITIQQLLSHLSGIANPIPLRWVHAQDEDGQFDSKKFFTEVVRKYSKLHSKPGTRFSYSNINYLILGHIIEKLTGDDYRDFVRKMIIQKLQGSGIYIDFIVKDYSNYASGYQKKSSWVNAMLGFFLDRKLWMEPSSDKNWLRFRKYYINGSSYGGLIANTASMTKYIGQLFTTDSPLLSNDFKKIMFSPQKLLSGKLLNMSLGWFMGKCRGHDYYAHPGAGGGYYCEFRFYPALNIISGIMMNRSGIGNEKILDRIDQFFI